LNAFERLNINDARRWAMRPGQLKRPDLVSDIFARELHRRMFNAVWRWAGFYRTTDKNLGWEVHRLTEGVRNAFEDARVWMAFSTYPMPEIAVRLHHRLVLIHPWANGNGRHARLIADVIMAADDRAGELTWGAKVDLVSSGEIRRRYIEAVRRADEGDFAPLITFARS
jgi:Fic-DOC domain mobile mystery protein B